MQKAYTMSANLRINWDIDLEKSQLNIIKGYFEIKRLILLFSYS